MARSSLLNVPYTGVQTTENKDPPKQWQTISVDEDMFGAAKGRAMQQLGRSIGSIGDAIGSIAAKNDQEQAETKTREIDTFLMKKHSEARDEYSRLDAPTAAEGFDAYDAKLNDIGAQATKMAGNNPRVKKMVAGQITGHYQKSWQYGFNTKTKAVKDHADEVSTARINQSVENSAKANNIEELEDPETGAIPIINGEVAAMGKRNTWSPERILEEQAKQRSSAYGKFIGNMAFHDPSMAQSYLDTYAGHLKDADIKAVREQIQSRHRAKTGPDAGRDLVDGKPPKDVAPYPLKPPPVFLPPTEPKTPGYYKKTSETEAPTETPPDQKTGSLDEGTVKLASGEVLEFSGQKQRFTPLGKPAKPIPGYPDGVDSAVVENYIVEQARLRGIHPGVALAVYHSEGATNWQSTVPGEPSYGPYQLYMRGGMGNDFVRDHPDIDPRDPNSWKENIEYGLNKAVEGGWGPWNGAKKIKITGRQGIDASARTIPLGKSNSFKVASDPEDLNEEPTAAEPRESPQEGELTQQMSSKRFMSGQEVEQFEKDIKADPASPIIHAYKAFGKIRALPPNPNLVSAIANAAQVAGIVFRMTSGGQTSERDPAKKDQPNGWTGSKRHDHGNAVDGDILDPATQKILPRDDPRRLAFLKEAAKNGAGGTGAGYMKDPGNLKVHIGITGASGKEGDGLGPYAGNDAEREAVIAGLKEGGHDTSTRFPVHDNSGHVQVAAYNPSGTVSDAPTPGYSGGQQYAQAGTPPIEQVVRQPITADTSPAEFNAAIAKERARLQSLGQEEGVLDIMEAEAKAGYAKKKEERAFQVKQAEDMIGKVIQGDPVNKIPPAENWDRIRNDPKLSQAWKDIGVDKQKQYTAQHEYIVSKHAKRAPTAADQALFDMLLAKAVTNETEFSKMNPYDTGLPLSMMKDLQAKKNAIISKGIGADPLSKMTKTVLSFPDVKFQLDKAQIPLNNAGMPPAQFASWVRGAIQLHIDTNNGRPPNQEQSTKIVNGLLRVIATAPPSKILGFEVPFTGGAAQRSYQVPMSEEDKAKMIKEYQDDVDPTVMTVDDITPWDQAYWRLNEESKMARKKATGK